MSEQLALGLAALGLLIAYIFVLYRLALFISRVLAARIGSRRGETIVDEDTGIEYDADDKIEGYDWVETGSGREMRAYSRADAQVRRWYNAVFFPLLLYLHYKFWEPISAGFEEVFQVVASVILGIFYGK